MKTIEAPVKVKWILDPAHSEIGFRVKHLMITNVKGEFKEFNASIYTVKIL
jgi:polyisoprenoid-binding protein YceI